MVGIKPRTIYFTTLLHQPPEISAYASQLEGFEKIEGEYPSISWYPITINCWAKWEGWLMNSLQMI